VRLGKEQLLWEGLRRTNEPQLDSIPQVRWPESPLVQSSKDRQSLAKAKPAQFSPETPGSKLEVVYCYSL